MWLLQRKNIHKKHLLWLKIVGFCLALHLIFLLWIFCVHQDNTYMHTLSINKNVDYSAPIMFVPLGTPTVTKVAIKQPPITQPYSAPLSYKASSSAKASADKSEDSRKATKGTPAVKADVKKTVITTTTPIPKAIPAVKQPTTTTVATNVKKIEEKITVVPKTSPVIEKKNLAIAKPEPKQPEKIAIAQADKKDISFDIPLRGTQDERKEKESEKKTEAKPLAKALDIQQSVVPTQPTKEISFDKLRMNGRGHAVHVPENARISNNFREVEALRRGAQLQKELVHKWQPPIGVSPECTCEISFFVNKKGIVENLKMVKSSGVIMFDISARQALFSMKMPQWTHGKPLIISFKQ
ncbi:MAG TPA: TonB C-terminal domain-containing protein [Candidatus Babeliales bacterium]|nr:TonB C-terminal domain-containing protein [Candidatus Babeliales bacterium]